MTLVKETRHIFDIDDIRNLRLVCGKCGAEMLFPPHQNRNIPKACPYCPSEWTDERAPKNPAWDGAVSLLQTIAYLSKLKEPCVSEVQKVGCGLSIDGRIGNGIRRKRGVSKSCGTVRRDRARAHGDGAGPKGATPTGRRSLRPRCTSPSPPHAFSAWV